MNDERIDKQLLIRDKQISILENSVESLKKQIKWITEILNHLINNK